jgi:hypothetical protein
MQNRFRRTASAVAIAAVLLALSGPGSTSGAAVSVEPWQQRLVIAAGGRGFIDGAGAWQLPLCAHFGEAFSAYVRRPEAVAEQLRAIRGAGYDCVRSWVHLGYYQQAWKGREVTPFSFAADDGTLVAPTPRYYEQLVAFLRLLDAVGLRFHLTQGDLNRIATADVRRHYARIADLLDEHRLQHVIALVEAINEDHVNGGFGPAILREWVEPFARRGYIVASSCPGGCTEEAADVVAYSRGFSVRYYHGDRGGDAVDRLKSIFTTTYDAPPGTPRLAWEGEPIGPNDFPGPGVSLNHTEDVEELGLLAVQRLIARGAWTYMSQYGVFWNGPIHTHSGFRAVPRMRAALAAFAPDVMTWPILVHGSREEAVLVSATGYHYAGGSREGPARIDQAVSPDGRRAVAVIYGGSGRKAVQNRMGCPASLTIVQPTDDAPGDMRAVTVAPGEAVDVEYRVGRLLLAACR